MKPIEVTRTRLQAYVTKAQALGAQVRAGDVGVSTRGELFTIYRDKCCCLLGTALIGTPRDPGEEYFETAAKVLDITVLEARELERGFEGWDPGTKGLGAWYALGQEFREAI